MAQHRLQRRLRVMARQQSGLGAPTIMDRALADKYGIVYVHLAVFAIDVDRVRAHHAEREVPAASESAALPFAWEVFLTEHYLLRQVDPSDAEQLSLIEELCLSVLDEAPGQPVFGDQVPFAVYDAVARGALPETLRSVFHHWRAKPKTLVRDLASLWDEPERHAGVLAQACSDTPIDPPAAPPTLAAWRAMADGQS